MLYQHIQSKLTYPKGGNRTYSRPCHVCALPSRFLLKAIIDALQISEQPCCRPFPDDWLSHPDYVHPHNSDFPPRKIYPERFGDLGMDPIEPVILLIGLILHSSVASGLSSCRNIIICDVVCSQGPRKYHSPLNRSIGQWTCSWCSSQSIIQCCRECCHGYMAIFWGMANQHVSPLCTGIVALLSIKIDSEHIDLNIFCLQ